MMAITLLVIDEINGREMSSAQAALMVVLP